LEKNNPWEKGGPFGESKVIRCWGWAVPKGLWLQNTATVRGEARSWDQGGSLSGMRNKVETREAGTGNRGERKKKVFHGEKISFTTVGEGPNLRQGELSKNITHRGRSKGE